MAIKLDTSDDPNEPEPRCGVCGLPYSYCECVIPWDKDAELPASESTESPYPLCMMATASTYQLFYPDVIYSPLVDATLRADALSRYGYPKSVIGQPHVSGLFLVNVPGRLVEIVHH